MAATEVSPRPVEAACPAPEDGTRPLREEVVELARALPGSLRRLTVRSGACEIEVEWATGATADTPSPAPQPLADEADAEVAEGTVAVRSPLVGTFYVAPSPDAEPFVRVGDEVEAGQTLGIVEAMKLMNPIVADEAGVVVEVLAQDAESVEYDQALLLIRLSGRSR
jgi:acetyl-CoA carboxylase biotin carboxyl carrier protein